MASGETLYVWDASDYQATVTTAAADTRNNHDVLDFDDAADEDAVFPGFLPRNYAGGGLTVTLVWASTGAVIGDVVWLGSFERIDDGGLDIDADSFAATQTATGTCDGTNGATTYTAIAFTSAQIDSLAVGEAFRFKATRDADAGADTMVGDAELLRVEIRET
jgi:hypothetical protein